jgi:hypothetical protein
VALDVAHRIASFTEEAEDATAGGVGRGAAGAPDVDEIL